MTLLLDKIAADVSSQLDAQAKLGVKITRQTEVPGTGPANRGVWFQIRNVTAVFADMKRSTELNANAGAQQAAVAYTYFIRAMTVILDRFGAGYIDVQGDGIFGLFGGPNSHFNAAACAITMRTQVEREVDARFRKATSGNRKLRAGIGMDRGTLLVRRLGLSITVALELRASERVSCKGFPGSGLVPPAPPRLPYRQVSALIK